MSMNKRTSISMKFKVNLNGRGINAEKYVHRNRGSANNSRKDIELPIKMFRTQ